MNIISVLKNAKHSAEVLADSIVRTRTPRVTDRSKSVPLGVVETLVLDGTKDEIYDAAATWCWWRVDWIKREAMPSDVAKRIRADGYFHVKMSDLLERVKHVAKRPEDMTPDELALYIQQQQQYLAQLTLLAASKVPVPEPEDGPDEDEEPEDSDK